MAKKLKLKTHRGAAKRFKVTSTGKILRPHSGKRHLMGTKKPKRMRHLKRMTRVHPSDLANVRQIVPGSASRVPAGRTSRQGTSRNHTGDKPVSSSRPAGMAS